jgi:hypothetical protein
MSESITVPSVLKISAIQSTSDMIKASLVLYVDKSKVTWEEATALLERYWKENWIEINIYGSTYFWPNAGEVLSFLQKWGELGVVQGHMPFEI